MRAFIALEPDPAAHTLLQTWLRRLRHSASARDVKWVHEDTLHATLRFLGDIDVTQKGRLIEMLHAQVTAAGPANMLRMSEPRLFPRPSQARIIACLIEHDAWLSRLVEGCERCAQAMGLPAARRPFTGHITLGRVRDLFDWRAFPDGPVATTPMQPSRVTLFKSTLTPQGPVYAALASVDL